MACPYKDRIMEELFPANAAANTSVWAVLDGARDQRIFYMLRDSGLDYLCLYSGHLQRELQLAAPYIVELNQDGAFTRRLLEHSWGNSWGIFVTTRNGPNLRSHLRKFLRVRTEAGKILVFRYYDPRIMRVYLPTGWTDELKTVFGPVERYLMEGKAADCFHEFSFDGLTFRQRSIQLSLAESNESSLDTYPMERASKSHLTLLVIRDQQMDVFQQMVDENFIARLCCHLREHHGAALEPYPDDLLTRMVGKGVARARSHGITYENKIAFFVALMVAIAPNFDEHPQIRKTLDEGDGTANERVDWLLDMIFEREWSEARSNYDPAAWDV